MSNAEKLKQNRAKRGDDIEIRDFGEIDENAGSIESYYEKILTAGDIDKALAEYSDNYDRITDEFLERTKLQGADLTFLFVAVALQCARIYLINKLSAIEKANSHGGKEDKLHDLQDKIFERMGGGGQATAQNLYASFDAIITTRGVPYDACASINDEIRKMKLFKGANHRFSTLGHDPLLGLVFGTANILTSTITTNRRVVVKTNTVVYDDYVKNPKIGLPVSTMVMLNAATDRFKDDKKSVSAAIIKQLIHIATDMYTPKGIQLPGASLVLSNTNVEKLTEYISTGDLVKIGASAGMAALINTIISAVHGCKLLFEDDGSEFSKELYQARTKKIITYSNCIASTSNLISTAMAGNMQSLDIGGLIVTIARLFSDARFLTKLEYEYINSGMSDIYEEKYADISLYY